MRALGIATCMIQVAGMALFFVLARVCVAKAGSFQPRVQIHSAVQVEGETVKLSDLLPPDAPGGLGEICRQVILGDAPLAASQRVISRVQIEQQLRQFPSTLQRLEIPDRVIVTRKRRRLLSTEILAAIETCMARGELDGFRTPNLNGLKLQAPVFVTKPDPGLEVRSVNSDPVQRKTRFLLWTSNEPQMLPFYVTIGGLQETVDKASSYHEQKDEVPVPTNSHADRGKTLADPIDPGTLRGLPGGRSPRVIVDKGKSARQATLFPMVLVAVGKPAKLIVETPTLRMTALVTPLESGVKGQLISVRNQDTQRVLKAEVVGAGLLQVQLGEEKGGTNR
jgi:hypothetical protein